MNIKCWQCSEQLDASSIERQVYQSLIQNLRGRLCEGSINDDCNSFRHEDCFVISGLIQELKGKL
jgi:hypothetical protein